MKYYSDSFEREWLNMNLSFLLYIITWNSSSYKTIYIYMNAEAKKKRKASIGVNLSPPQLIWMKIDTLKCVHQIMFLSTFGWSDNQLIRIYNLWELRIWSIHITYTLLLMGGVYTYRCDICQVRRLACLQFLCGYMQVGVFTEP